MKRFLGMILTTVFFTFLSGCGLVGNEETSTTPEASSPSESTPAATSPVEVKTPQNYRINMTEGGFSPTEVSIHVGDTVNFVNTDSESHWPASAFHPTHQNLPGFDSLQGVPAGSTYAYTFTKVGTWGFHDHLHAEIRGQIIVTE